ncbi:MAG: hypothetical protein IID18_01540, partial [Nitrospinae bacterium]|nr:hypothetical protein [Nitrospinota bacterium]
MNEHNNLTGSLGRFFLHFSGIVALFFLVVLIRYPALVNAEYFLGYDEAFMAAAIVELMNGGPMFFFYEGANYHGVLGGITAIPFMWLLGIGSLAYKLPGSLY